MTLLGIDIGGSGSRLAVRGSTGEPGTDERTGSDVEVTGPRVEVGADGSSVQAVVLELLDRTEAEHPGVLDDVQGVGVGATGLASLVDDPGQLADVVAGRLGVPVAVAIDAVAAHLGALDGQGGAVVALGTGAIAIGHPDPAGAGQWRRVDGWGHLLGDRGGGAWIGRHALELALLGHDGVDDAGARLLEAATERFGPPAGWPGVFYTRPDRAGLLAEYVPDVTQLADDGDQASRDLMHRAGCEAAVSVLAALDSDGPARVALTGGLTRAGGALLDGFQETVAARASHVTVVDTAGDVLAGTIRLAHLAAEGRATGQDGFVWVPANEVLAGLAAQRHARQRRHLGAAGAGRSGRSDLSERIGDVAPETGP